MALTTRGQLIQPSDTVQLTAVFVDDAGNFVDTDSLPQISIIDPTGAVTLPATSLGMARTALGHYLFDYTVGINGQFGVWTDNWLATINGFSVGASFNFVVTYTDYPGLNTDGYIKLGDDVGFQYSQLAISNINKLVKMLRARLRSSGKSSSKDGYGNIQYITCDVFSVDMLVTFIANGLSDFNQIPLFTNFTFEDTAILDQFGAVIVDGATLVALASQALIERGREFTITDNGVSFSPPLVSDVLNTQYNALLTQHYDKLKYIKNSLRAAPLGLGKFNILQTNSPAMAKYKHVRARQIL